MYKFDFTDFEFLQRDYPEYYFEVYTEVEFVYA